MKINLGNGTTAEITSIKDIDLDKEVVYFEGERLTEARAEAIARDIAARHGRKGGRPPLAAETSRPDSCHFSWFRGLMWCWLGVMRWWVCTSGWVF